MARIDLIDVCKTLSERDVGRRGSGSSAGRAGPSAATSERADAATFSIQHLNLRIPDAETMVVLGPSGCGKTTLLKIIAGLIAPDSGEVWYDDVDVKEVRPGDRRIGMVFQNYALYPHLSSRTNVLSYFLFRKKTPELNEMARAKYQRTSDLMGVELAYLLDRKPTTLSGGEKQRVALGRCITRDPAVFLLDEPFSNLDQALREKYRANLKVLLKQFNITTVYVTHDHYEALILADRLAIMDRGSIEQVGTYEEIYRRPENIFVAKFLNRHVGGVPISLVEPRCIPGNHELGDVLVGVRPEDVEVSREERPDGMCGVVAAKATLPLMNAAMLDVRGEHCEVHAEIAGDDDYPPGQRVWLTLRRYHLFDRQSGARLGSRPAIPGDRRVDWSVPTSPAVDQRP